MGYSKTGVITYKKKPEKGEPGPKGPFVYPAGIYVQGSDTQYTATALTAPMVVFEKQMYILNVVGTVGSDLNPKDDYAANGSKATWVLMPQYKAAYYEIFFAEFAKLGSAIFSGDYMLSQHGVDAQGRESTDFEKFNPATNDFTPNIMIDWLTGKMKGKDVDIEGSIKAKEGWIGSVNRDAEGKLSGNGLVLEYDGIRSVNFSNADGIGTYYSTRGMAVYASGSGILTSSTGMLQAARIVADGDNAGVYGLEIIAKCNGYLNEVKALVVNAQNRYGSPKYEPIAIEVENGLTRLRGKLEVLNDASFHGSIRFRPTLIGTTKRYKASDYPSGTLLLDTGQNSGGWYMIRVN